jgi:hypothetical protein
MRSKLIIALVLLAAFCAISVESAWAQSLPPLQGLVWTNKVSYGVGETIPVLYLVTKPASVTVTITNPAGITSTFNNRARGSTVLTFTGRGGQPIGRRTVNMRAVANDNPREVINVRTTFNVEQFATFAAPGR